MQANFTLRSMVAAIAGTFLFGATQVAMADSADNLLKKLHDKGVLTDEEYDQFNAERDTEKVKKRATEIKASFKDGFKWSDNNGDSISINGRVQADFRGFDVGRSTSTAVSPNNATTFDIRRAYLSMKGTFYNYINFEGTYDAGNGTGTSPLKYYWLEFAPSDVFKLRFGQFKMPMGLEQLTSSRFIDMTERDWVATLAPAVNKGVMLHGVPTKGLTYAVSVSNGGFVADNGQNAIETGNRNDGKEVNGRVTANFAQLGNIQDWILHAGGAFGIGWNLPATGTSLAFRTNGRGSQFFTSTANTTNPMNHPDVVRYGLEGILANGPFKLQAEMAEVEFTAKPSADTALTLSTPKAIKAYYANLSWMITGESYSDAYKDGVMDRMRPKNDFVAFGAPGIGAWEVGARFSKFDASDFVGNAAGTLDYDTDLSANEAKAYSLGLKWIPNPNTRFMLDFVNTDFSGAAITPQVATGIAAYNNEKALNFRAQFDW